MTNIKHNQSSRIGLIFGLLLTATLICLAVFQFKNTPSLAFQATAVSPDSGSVTGGQQITITGVFDERDKIKEVFSTTYSALALSENGQIYFWGQQGWGYDGIGQPCLINGEQSWEDNQVDCENAGGVWYPERDLPDYMTTPANINQIAAGDIGPSTVIEKLAVNTNGSMETGDVLALDDQGQVYSWGYYPSSAPTNLNLLGGDITPSTRIEQIYVWGSSSSLSIFIDSDGIVYGSGYYLAPSGLISSSPCSNDNYYNEQACVDNGGTWNESLAEFFNDPTIPINLTSISDLANVPNIQKIAYSEQGCYVLDGDGHIWANDPPNGDLEFHDINQIAAGDINPSTQITDIEATAHSLYALDDQGQLYLWGEDLESNNYTVPTNLSQIGFGDINQSVRLVKIKGQYRYGRFLAIDDQGQVYSYLEDSPGNGEEYPNAIEAINVSAAAAGDLDDSVEITSVSAHASESGNYLVSSTGQVYTWGTPFYSPALLVHPCSVSGSAYPAYDQADCESSGGTWDPEKDLNPLVPSEITKFGVFGDMSEPDYTVTIDGEPCENVALVDKNTITCTVPAHTAGLVDIAITDNLGNSETLQQAYTYEASNPDPDPSPNPAPSPGAPIVPGVPNTGRK
jgi:alpha-tubulin suppressor-like RCC1 family protein